MNRRSFLAAAALSPLARPAQACPAGAEGLMARLKERRVPALDLSAGATPEALESAAEALRISESWISVSSMSSPSASLRAAARADAEAVGAALDAVAAWLERLPAARLRRYLERLRLEPALERAWRETLTRTCPPALAARLDARVDEVLEALLSGPALPQVRAWTGALRRPGPALPHPTAKRAPPGQRIAVGAVLSGFGGLVLSRGVLMLLASGPSLWPFLFAGLGALILALGVGVLVVAIQDLRAAG